MRFYEIIKEGYKEVKVKFSQETNSDEINNYFDKFRDLVNRNQVFGDEKNIDWWGKQGWNKFKEFVDNKSDKKTKTQLKRSKIKGDFHVIKDDEDWLIIVPLNKDASCYFGKNTKWCVTKRSQTHFEEYFYEGQIALIYFINKKTNQKWAMADHIKVDEVEYFDSEDTKISEKKFLEQTGIEPELLEQIDDDVRFGELYKKIMNTLQDYEDKASMLWNAIDELDMNEQSDEIENKIMELGDITLVEKYLEIFEDKVNFSKEFQTFLLNLSEIYIRHFRNPSLGQQMKVMEKNYLNFRYIHNPHPQVQEYYAEYVDDRYDSYFEVNVRYKLTDTKAQIILMNRLPWFIGYIKHPTVEVQLAAVKKDGSVIRDIKQPIKEVQMAAINENPDSLRYIEHPYPEVIVAAVKDDPRVIAFIKSPSKEIQKMAVDIDPFVINRISNPDPEIKKYAEEQIKS